VSRRHALTAVLLGCLAATGCTADRSSPGPGPAPQASPSVAGEPSPDGSVVPEPTTTNTLPPPPPPTAPAPTAAGELTASALPVPAGWRTIAREGGHEEGFQGNGTWVHARDARYAARDVITIGCSEVTRDDYPDPVAALEGSYQSRSGGPGVGLVLQFASPDAARAYYDRYRQQVAACTSPDGPVVAKVLASRRGLIDRRTYPDGEWIEMGALRGRRLTLVILSDPGHEMSKAAAEKVLAAATAS
jgi:hypothetical protein